MSATNTLRPSPVPVDNDEVRRDIQERLVAFENALNRHLSSRSLLLSLQSALDDLAVSIANFRVHGIPNKVLATTSKSFELTVKSLSVLEEDEAQSSSTSPKHWLEATRAALTNPSAPQTTHLLSSIPTMLSIMNDADSFLVQGPIRYLRTLALSLLRLASLADGRPFDPDADEASLLGRVSASPEVRLALHAARAGDVVDEWRAVFDDVWFALGGEPLGAERRGS
ncbi:hypothetical protein ANO11243_015090 [Dothideomycetidae sp. 11243]|nr:hypothetical protein ANO11243_015090 [fungal sp. No.11243]